MTGGEGRAFSGGETTQLEQESRLDDISLIIPSAKRKQVDKKNLGVSGLFKGLKVRKSSAECSRQPFWMPVNKCWACVLLGLGNVQA